jgi:dihydrofolate synthase / folylpolyglutamate synthase
MASNYQEIIEYLYTKLPMFSKIGKDAYKKDIINTIKLCSSIGDPQNLFRSIHIAGTNGKGSVSHILAAIFQQSGYKTGLYTSPHLKDFRERIKINGQMIPEQFVIDFVQNTKPITEEIEPSFFELTVAMAFDYFAKEKVDIAIIETGLGGRLDSTNIIIPILSIITNIGYDHMNILGNTLEEIAFEKAGIIKEKVPTVIGEVIPETKNIFLTEAQKRNAPILFAEAIVEITNAEQVDDKLQISLTSKKNGELKTYISDLSGLYQQKNIRTVATAIGLLNEQGFQLDDKDVGLAISKVKKLTGLHGRWEIIQQHPQVVLDVAHNEDGIKQINEQLSLCNYKNLHIVFGMVKDKEIDKVLSLLPKNAHYYFTKAQIPRALPEDELMTKANFYDLHGVSYNNVNGALNAALANASKDDLILVTGSFFIVGEVNYQY